MLIRIKKLQFLCGAILLMQVLCPMWIRPVSFNCNIVIDSDHWLAKTLFVSCKYNIIIMFTILYCYRIWLLSCTSMGNLWYRLYVFMFIFFYYDYSFFVPCKSSNIFLNSLFSGIIHNRKDVGIDARTFTSL
mgnify:CR=1 FL=1